MIAARYGVSAQDVRRWNNLTQNAVGVGKRLRIVSDSAPAGRTPKVRRAAGNRSTAARGNHRAGD
jgi:LysM repeat protein